MGFEQGNKIWEQRKNHGREKTFKTPLSLWETAVAYFHWSDSNPLKRNKLFGTGLQGDEEIPRPYTVMAFCIFIGVNTTWFRNFKVEMAKRDDEESRDFSRVINDVEEIVYTQKFDGASAGYFNANIISRDLGLIDRREVENKGVIAIQIDGDDAKLGVADNDEPGNDNVII